MTGMLPTTKPFVCAAMALSVLSCAAAETVNPALWSGLKYRMIGPERGGRVTTVTGVPSQPNTFYMGSTGGGVWKTTVGQASWPVGMGRRPAKLHEKLDALGGACFSLPAGRQAGHAWFFDPWPCLAGLR
jgi:hypothetical protein